VILWVTRWLDLRIRSTRNSAAPNIQYSVVEGGCPASATCGSGNLDTNPNLGSLADNGGPTMTIALEAGSSAIDTGSDTHCNTAPISRLDQRGVIRPQWAHCDIGAFEKAPPILPETLGVTSGGMFYLRHSNSAGSADRTFSLAGLGPSAGGDWDGDGDATVGIDASGVFFLRNSNSAGRRISCSRTGGPAHAPRW